MVCRNDASKDQTEIKAKINKMTVDSMLAFEGKFNKDTGIFIDPSPSEYTEYRENDNISHFICRLAYCRNEELRKWFLTQETRLFQLRLSGDDKRQIKELLKEHLDITYQAVKETDPEWVNPETREDITFNRNKHIKEQQ